MTQIRSLVGGVCRRPNELGVHSLDRFVMAAPDLKVAEVFHRSFGLDAREEGQGLGIYADGSAHRWGSIVEGSHKQLHHLSFGAFEDDMQRFRVRIEDGGIRLLDPPPGFESNGLWFRDHDGTLIEIRVAEKSSPDDKPPVDANLTATGVRGAPKRSQSGVVRPRRLAHMLLFTSDVDRAIAFYARVLGLRLSDRSGSNIAFMHGVHGSDHHMIAFVKSEGPGIHHTSWDVASVHEVGLGAMQMADRGFAKGWGLGRHVLGSNYFHYVRDPWGSYAEYSCDMDYIPVSQDWEAGDHDGEDAFYVWGPQPPSDFAINHEIVR